MAGVSDNENKDQAVQWIKETNPQRVLDVGAGMGIYSILAKEQGQHWTALEVFAPYVNMFNLRSRYEDVVVADARYVDYSKLGTFDLIIAADMLEHMPKEHAADLILTLLKHTQNLLICFPLVHHDQEAGFEGNDFESHIDHWDFEEMEAFLFDYNIDSIRGEVLAYFLVRK